MSDFKGTPGPYQFVPIEKWPFGFEIKAGEYTLVAQDSWGWASGQKTRADNEQALGFESDQKQKVIAAIARQDADGRLLAASWDLLAACKGAMRIAELWCPADQSSNEHQGEYEALELMRQTIDAAIRKARGES